MVKFLVIGDPHGSEKLTRLDLRGYDAAIITGDMGRSDVMRNMAWGKVKPSKRAVKQSYMEYSTTALPVFKHISKGGFPVFCVKGNADLSDSDIRGLNKEMKAGIPLFEAGVKKMKNVIFLEHAAAKFKGVTIAGVGHFMETRWVSEFSDGSLEKMLMAAIDEEVAKLFFQNVGKVDIMLSHQPPYGVLDTVKEKHVPKGWRGRHAGSVQLLDYIKKYQPKYVICGHIHEAKGVKRVGKTTAINAGCCGAWQTLIIRK